MQDTESSSIEECPSCGTAIDVTGAEPLMRLNCPVCGTHFTFGRFMGHYELLEEVGRGGMGVVYKALDTNLGRHVALKVLRKDNSENEELMKQLETEAAITASINHPHVVRVFSTGTAEGRFFIAMELVDKGTLDDLIELQGTVAEAQVLDVAIQISQGLRAAYQHGLIHRDVKPGNILFSDSKTAKIVDFGLATLEQAAASTGEIWGTPYYVAPEKLDQKPEDFRSDMYSLGATLFHALAGRPPFEAADATLVALKHLKSEAVSLQAFAPHVSGSTAYVINRTLSKDPDKRYQSYDEFIEHLEYARREFAENANKPKVKQRLAMENEKDQRLWGLITFAMLGLLVAAGVGAFFFLRKKEKSTSRETVEVAVPTPGAPRTAEGRAFEAARSLLVSDDLENAVKNFRAVAANPKTPEPYAQWAYVHEGLAHLLAGRTAEARQAFAALKNLGGPKGEGAKYAPFFTTLAEKAQSTEIIPSDALRDFDRTEATPLGALILGLIDWEQGAFDQATPLIRSYHSAPAGKELPWLADYKPLISPYVADLAAFRGAVEMAKEAKTLDDQRAALDAAANARQGLSAKSKSGKMASTLDTLIADLQTKTAAAPNVASLSKEEQQANFDRSLARLQELVEKWQFVEARNDIRAMQVHDFDFIKKRDLLTLKARWLEEAKEVIVAECAAGASGVTLTRKDGRPVGTITGASGEGLQTNEGLIPWPEIAPEGPIALLAAPKGGKTDVDRLWGAGVLAAWAGLNEIAIKHLVAAARGQRRYLDALPAVWPGMRVESENVALKRAVRASAVTKLEEAAEKAVDGSITTSWAANKAGAKYLQVDLVTPRIVNRWIVKHARSTGVLAEPNATLFSLEASVDGKAWAEVDSVRQNVSDVTHRTILPTKARFFRLHVLEPVAIHIAEFELYGGSVDATAQRTYFNPDGPLIVPSLDVYGIGLSNPSQLGSTNVEMTTGAWTVRMASRDIWDEKDSMVFLYRPFEGDGEIVIHPTQVESVDPFTKLGVMFRETLEPGSRYVMTCTTAQKGFSFQHRPETNGQSNSVKREAPAATGRIKIMRQGNTFTSFSSTDSLIWEQLGEPVTMELPRRIFVGVATTSHSVDRKATLEFSNIRLLEKPAN